MAAIESHRSTMMNTSVWEVVLEVPKELLEDVSEINDAGEGHYYLLGSISNAMLNLI